MSVSVVLPVLVKEAWQEHMTSACVAIMCSTTGVPFELVVVESESDHFGSLADIHVKIDPKQGPSKDVNKGFEAATGDFVVFTGNDVFTRPGWLEALLACFDIPDCGVATLRASELQLPPTDRIIEGVYCPLMMFRKGWRFDEAYPGAWGDTDLIMRIYEQGQRSYRNNLVTIDHIGQATDKAVLSAEESKARFMEGQRLFIERHAEIGGHLRMFHYLVQGVVI